MNKKASFIIPTVIIKEAKLGSISRFFRGVRTGPEDFLRFLDGQELQDVKHLGRAGQIGNIAGAAGTGGAVVTGAHQLLSRIFGGNKKEKDSGSNSGNTDSFYPNNSGNYDSFTPHAKFDNKLFSELKNNKLVDSIVPDLDSMPSGFQSNQLLQTLSNS